MSAHGPTRYPDNGRGDAAHGDRQRDAGLVLATAATSSIPSAAVEHGLRAGRRGRRRPRHRRRVDPPGGRGGERRGGDRPRDARDRGPVARRLRRCVSIDTSKAEVAERALAAGATIVNDVTALARPGDGGVVRRGEARRRPHAHEGNAADDAGRPDLRRRRRRGPRLPRRRGSSVAVARGVAEERIWLDPGIGFGKTVEHNLELIDAARRAARARPPDRARRLAQELPRQDHRPRGRRPPRRLARRRVIGVARGADMLRVHDVAATREALARRRGDPRRARVAPEPGGRR